MALSVAYMRVKVKEVRKVLASTKLESFEVAQLANLMPERAEEAKTLIPRFVFCFCVDIF
jgi:hypothetical protein